MVPLFPPRLNAPPLMVSVPVKLEAVVPPPDKCAIAGFHQTISAISEAANGERVRSGGDGSRSRASERHSAATEVERASSGEGKVTVHIDRRRKGRQHAGRCAVGVQGSAVDVERPGAERGVTPNLQVADSEGGCSGVAGVVSRQDEEPAGRSVVREGTYIRSKIACQGRGRRCAAGAGAVDVQGASGGAQRAIDENVSAAACCRAICVNVQRPRLANGSTDGVRAEDADVEATVICVDRSEVGVGV